MVDLIERHRAEILRLADSYGAANLRVFGSAARGDATDKSDVDLLVDWREGASLSDWSGLQQDLQDLLGCRVDVVSAHSLHWYIRDRVLAQARPLS